MAKRVKKAAIVRAGNADYDGLLSRVSALLEQGRRSTVRTTNAILAATYWEVGRQIVEYEQRAYDTQGGDWNNEVFPAVRDLRGVLARCGRPIAT